MTKARLGAPLAIVFFLALLFFAPAGFRYACPTRALFGIPCPTCGMTRAARLLAHGDFAGATRMHPLWFVVLPFFAALVTLEIAGYLRHGEWGRSMRVRGAKIAGLVVGALLVAVWIARFLGALGGPAPA